MSPRTFDPSSLSSFLSSLCSCPTFYSQLKIYLIFLFSILGHSFKYSLNSVALD